MKKMPYLKVFLDWLDAIEPLSDAERGRLFTALMQYARTGEAPQLSGNERFLYPMLRAQVDRDQEEYAEYCEKQTRNGKKGGRPKEPKAAENPPLFSETQKSQDKDKEEDKDKDEDDPPKAPQGAADRFEQFWEFYPKKKGKADAKKAWDKLSPDEALYRRIWSALDWQKQTQEWQKEQGRYIPYPATWLRGRRWEDQPEAKAAEAPVHAKRGRLTVNEYGEEVVVFDGE